MTAPRTLRRSMLPVVIALVALAGACTQDEPEQRATATPSESASPTPTPTRPPTPSASASIVPSASPTPTPYVRWPVATRGPAPPALGAVVTVRRARTSTGSTLAASLTLPRVGGTPARPTVLTPCGRRVTLSGGDVRVIPPASGGRLPKRPADVLVVLDPGHGGSAAGAIGPRGTREKERVLQLAREVRAALQSRVGRVVLTRDRDMDASLPFRVALADALRADLAVSVHLNAAPDGPRATPGLETYGSIADPGGRRAAGVLYESQRRYLDTLGGPWVGDRDAGAKYRLNASGTDYYGLLRRAHRTWVISESMFISHAREEALVARPDIRTALGRAIADGITAFTTSHTPGSGWVRPYPRPADPGGGASRCVDPS